jgi:glutaminyl-tRNA synthetase
MAVIDPIKVTIRNYEEGRREMFECVNNPEDESAGKRQVPFGREIYISRNDFMENPPKKYFRLSPGGEVRLRYSYLIKCEEVIKDAEGNVTELICSYDPESGNGGSSDGRRVKGVIHWVSAADAVEAEVRLFNNLFIKEDPNNLPEGMDWMELINPESMVVTTAYMEPSLADAPVGVPYQFERVGYFCKDKDSTPEKPVFNRTVELKSSFVIK